jgi:hypothetical protein
MIKSRAFQADLVFASNSHGASTSLPTSGLHRTNRAVYSESLWVSLLLLSSDFPILKLSTTLRLWVS